MKKTVALMLSILLLFTLSACAGDSGQESGNAAENPPAETVIPSLEAQGSAAAEPEASVGGKALVLYFSCTGNTEAVAREIAAQTGAEVMELLPEEPYTEDDLNYQDDNCRANQEMNDENARPAISGRIENLSDYDTLYIGFPIWWGTMPRIMNTFFDEYDLSGETVMPFCTSGGSGIDQAVSAIREAEPDAEVREGLRVGSGSSENCTEAVSAWLEGNE